MNVRFRPPAPAGPLDTQVEELRSSSAAPGTWFDDHGWSAQVTVAAR